MTHAANHCRVQVVRSDGFTSHSLLGDSLPGTRPRGIKSPASGNVDRSPPVLGPAIPDQLPQHEVDEQDHQPLVKSAKALREARCRGARATQVQQAEQSFQAYWHENRDQTPAPVPPPVSAKGGLHALRRRVLSNS